MEHVRKIELEGIVNFRDMGGYKTRDGRKVKKGLLYRSGELGNMTEKDQQLLQELGIKTILDYRDEDEARYNETPNLSGVDIFRVPAKRADSVLQTASVADLLQGDLLSNLDDKIFYKFYEELPFNNIAYKRLINLIKNPSGAILHHCSAGKDRTGVGAAIIHMILDVPKESIFEDYLKTNEAIKDSLPAWINLVRELLPEGSPNLLMFTGVHESFLQAAFEAIYSTYGSVESYLAIEYGITEGLRSQIQDFYLE